MSFFRFDGNSRLNPGPVIAGANIAVLSQPANTSTQPGTPLAVLYSASSSNSASLSSASYVGGVITFVFSSTPPADVITGSFIAVSAVIPTGYNGVWQVVTVVGNNVTVVIPYTSTNPNPGTYSSGGTVATSSLPNPFQSDGNGNWFYYAAQSLYTIQIYGGSIPINQLVFADQIVVSPGGGTVTSVALTVPAELSVSGSPILTSGTLAIAKVAQSANLVYAGPATGANAAPTFRALVAADISGLGTGTVTSVGLSVVTPSWLTTVLSGTPVSTTGTLTATITGTAQSANTVLAGPTSGGSGAPTFRPLVPADLQVAHVDLTGQTAAITTTTLYSVVTAGEYLVSWNSKVTTVASTGAGTSTLGALTITYVDPDAVTQTITCGAQSNAGVIETTDSGNTTTTVLLGVPLLLNCKASSLITYAFAYASDTAAQMAYNLHIKVQ